MEGATLAGLIGIASLFVLLALRMPVAITLIVVGGLGIAALNSSGSPDSATIHTSFEWLQAHSGAASESISIASR